MSNDMETTDYIPETIDRILLVDDNIANLQVLREALSGGTPRSLKPVFILFLF